MTKTEGTKEWAYKTINYSSGCSNNCQYCWAKCLAVRNKRKTLDNWKDMSNKVELGDRKYRKVNNPDPEKYAYDVMSPSTHDITPYNVFLAKKIYTNLLKAGNTLLIVSKPKFRVIEVLRKHLKEYKDNIMFRFTIGTTFDEIRNLLEPNAPNIFERFYTLQETYFDDFNTSLSIEPYLDPVPERIMTLAQPYITGNMWLGPMNFKNVPSDFKWKSHELYSKKVLFDIKKRVDALGFKNVRYKDAFINTLKEK